MAAFDTTNDNPGYPAEANMGGCLYYTWRDVTFPTQSFDSSRAFLVDTVRSVIAKRTQAESDSHESGAVFAEIGVYGGASLFHVYENCANSHCIGIDPFDTIEIFNGKPENDVDSTIVANARAFLKQNYERIVQAIETHRVGEHVSLLRTTAANASESIADGSIDVLHIDGDHSSDGVYSDLCHFQKKMRRGGVIVCDDANWPSVARGVARFATEYGVDNKLICIDGTTHKFTIQF